MKRIKTVNGYAIYQGMSQRDEDNYHCDIGCFNLYISADIRDYGLANSYPEYENIDSMAAAIELANGSNYAIAFALAEELSDSTIQDMDLVMEIERRLDAGETVEQITEKYDTINQTFEENEEENVMTHSNDTHTDECTITRNRRWGRDTVREACIANHLYTCGDNEAYNKMLDMVERTSPTTKAMYLVAKDIQEHSKDQTITNVMFILEREAVITTFEIDGSDMI